ncbi:MAG: hypothetical protein ACPIGG_02215 [Akkermansiaceae bacterium]
MNKVFILILLGSIFTLAKGYSRTWTSADGQQTFEGKLRSYNKATGNVKVIKGMKQFSFHVDILSEADRAWLETQVSDREEKNDGGAKVLEELGRQVIGAKLKEGVLSKLEGGEFVDYTMSFAPKYYLVYFSASW